MTKQKEFQLWIEKQIKYYKPILDLNLQDILVKYDNNIEYLLITNTYPYLDPVIKFSDTAIKEWEEGYLKKDRILHELCHIITDPLYNKGVKRFVGEKELEDERERLTDIMCSIIRNLDK